MQKRSKSRNFDGRQPSTTPTTMGPHGPAELINEHRRMTTAFCTEHGISRKQLRKLQKKETKKMMQQRHEASERTKEVSDGLG